MKINSKFLTLFLSIVLVIAAFSVMATGFGESSETDIVMVSLEGENDLTSIENAGGEILQEYPDRALVEMPIENRFDLEKKGLDIRSLENRDYVGLLAHSFHTNEGEPDLAEGLELNGYEDEEEGYYILQFIGPIKNEWKEDLKREGVTFHEFRHRFNFVVEMDQDTKEKVESYDFVEWTGIYQPAYRIDRDLLDNSGEQLIEVSFFDGVDLRESAIDIDSLGGNIQAISRNKITAEIHTERIEKLANLRGVNAISEGMKEPELHNDDATWVTQTNEEDNRKVTDQGVTGDGQLLTVCDSELYTTDDGHEMWEDPDGNDFGDDHRKVQDYYSIGGDLNDGAYHGTHVTGTVLGDAPDNGEYGTYNNYDGNAIDARLIHQDIGTSDDQLSVPDDMYNDAWQRSYDEGSRAHTNSWGGGISSYTGLAIDGDEFIWDNKDYNILFAMGNDGPDAETMSGEPEGKNFFSVGAVSNYPDQNTMADFSSRGYADDGRIKPTVLHVGESVDSADRDYDAYSNMDGTSMSTPGIAGQVGQVRQYYEDGFYVDGTSNEAEGFNPSNALVRATMINGAVEITGDGAYNNDARFPNNDQGYGRSNLDRVLHFDGDDRKLIAYDSGNDNNELDTGESWTTEFDVDDPTQELELTLAWSDYPGSDGSDSSDPAIVNDLDLEVTAPDGTRYVGNAFTGNDPGYSEADPTDNPWNGQRDGEYDGLNVEEDILLLPDQNGVEEGTYEVTVSADQVPEGTQPFALTVSGGVTDAGPSVNVTKPQGGETWEYGTTETIQWDTEEDEDPIDSVDIEYSIDGGSSFDSIATGIDDTGSYDWDIPDETSESAVIKVTANDTGGLSGSDTSDQFTLLGSAPAPPENLDVEHSGTDNVTVFEDDVEGGDLGYTTGESTDASIWDIRQHGASSGSNSWDFGDGDYNDPGSGGLSWLISPEIDLTDVSNSTLTFQHWRDFESADALWDGANLKVSTEGVNGSWTSVDNPSPAYDGTIETDYDNPLGDESGWGHEENNWEEVTVDLSDYDGETLWLNWSAGVDTYETTHEGWRIDDINVTGEGSSDGTEDNLVTWDASPDDPDKANQYYLQRSEEENGNYSEIATIDADGSSSYEYLDEDRGDVDDTLWWYKVLAEDDVGQSSEETSSVQEPGSETYNLTVDSTTGGSVGSPGEGTFEYNSGEEVDLEAVADDGYHFVEWTGDTGTIGDPTANQTTITMEGEYSITAEFGSSEVDEVLIYPDTDQTVEAGEELTFDAEAYDQDGNLITDDPTEFDWQNAVDGVFYETETGDYDVTATYDGVTSPITTVTVEPAEAKEIDVTPQNAEIVAGESQVYNATATDDWGNEFDVTGETTWSDDSDDSEWTDNEVTVYSAGGWNVTGEYENATGTSLTDTASLTVEPGDVDSVMIYPEEDQVVQAGEEFTFDAESYDSYGNLITGNADDFTWENTSNGVFYETETGDYDVTATYEEITSNITTVTVEAGDPDYIEIEPQNKTVISGDTVTYYSTAYDEYGNEVDNVTADTDWSVDDGAGGEWNQNEYTTENEGEWNITGVYNYNGEDLTDKGMLQVDVSDIDEVIIDPENDQTITAGEKIIFNASAYDSNGNLVTEDRIDFEWQGATRGVFNRRRAAEYEVTATYEGVTSNPTYVTVEPAEEARLEISPEEETAEAGTTVTYTAIAYDEYENEIGDVSGDTTWSIDSGAGGSWTGSDYTAEVAGDWTVTGDYNGITDTALLTVNPGTVDTVELTPSSDQTITSGEQIEFSAVAYDAYGNIIADNVEAFTWENATRGIFYYETTGQYDVTATYNGVTSQATTVTVEEDSTNSEVGSTAIQTVEQEDFEVQDTGDVEVKNAVDNSDTIKNPYLYSRFFKLGGR